MTVTDITRMASSPLTELPSLAAQILPAHLVPLLSTIGAAARPALSSAWQTVASNVNDNWADGTSNRAAASVSQAASSAAELEQHATSIDQAIVEGATAIADAVADITAIATQFLQKSLTSLAGGAATPAGLIGSASVISSYAADAFVEIQQRLTELENELSGPLAALQAAIAAPSSTPTAPSAAPAALPAPPPEAAGLSRLDTPPATDATSSAPSNSTTSTPSAAAVTTPAATAPDSPSEGGGGSKSGGADLGSDFSSDDQAPTPQAQQAVQHALSAVGTPYQWGGNTPGVGLDCSGLTHWAYGQAGVDIPRVAESQTVGRQVSQDELLPGDLVVWSGHVAMVVGDGMMVEAGDPVQVNPVRTSNIGMEFKGFYRPTG